MEHQHRSEILHGYDQYLEIVAAQTKLLLQARTKTCTENDWNVLGHHITTEPQDSSKIFTGYDQYLEILSEQTKLLLKNKQKNDK